MIAVGFATVSLLSYKNLEGSTDGFFSGMEKNKSFEINSKVVTAIVSNRNTSHLNEPVILTFYHLKQVRKEAKSSILHFREHECHNKITVAISIHNWWLILFHRTVKVTTPVCTGIPPRMAGHGLLVAAVSCSPMLTTLYAPATI